MTTQNWQLRRRIERQYAKSIEQLMKGLRPRLNGVDSPFLVQQIISNYARSPTFKRIAKHIAQSMATSVFSDGHRTWREAARAGSKGRMIYNALKKELNGPVGKVYRHIIENNAELIRSVPPNLAQRLSKKAAEVYESGQRGKSFEDAILSLVPDMTRSHARLIARTETSKASTALTQARAEAAGVDWYVWRTSEDERVRDSHRKMEGVVISWDEPPSPEKLNHERSYGAYHAGNIFNCRCYPQPLLEYDDVSWPAKVFFRGKLQHMTLARFKELTGGEL